MNKILFCYICVALSGCQYNTVSHTTAQGAVTHNTNISFLTRSHSRIQTQQGSPNPIPASEPFSVPDTASNATGLESIVNQSLARNQMTYPINEVHSTVDANGKTAHSYFVYDLDTDPEPGVRVFRIGTVGVVAGQIVN